MYFNKVDIPYTRIIKEFKTNSSYVSTPVSPDPWIEEYGLTDICAGKDVLCLVVWVRPKHRIPPHMDFSEKYGPALWSLCNTLEDHNDVILEAYKQKDNTTASIIGSPVPGATHSIPLLSFKDADVIETWPMTQGPVVFNPGYTWHGAYNPSDEWRAVISLRSLTMEHWNEIEPVLSSRKT
jgi:hypothetical protein